MNPLMFCAVGFLFLLFFFCYKVGGMGGGWVGIVSVCFESFSMWRQLYFSLLVGGVVQVVFALLCVNVKSIVERVNFKPSKQRK